MIFVPLGRTLAVLGLIISFIVTISMCILACLGPSQKPTGAGAPVDRMLVDVDEMGDSAGVFESSNHSEHAHSVRLSDLLDATPTPSREGGLDEPLV